MKRPMKRALTLLLCLVAVLCCAVPAFARTLVDTTKPVTLTLSYQYGTDTTTPISNAELWVYQVATMDKSAEFALTEDFATCGIALGSIDTEAGWKAAAGSFMTYLGAHTDIEPLVLTTGDDGTVTKTGLAQGLYLLVPQEVILPDYTYNAAASLFILPDLDPETDQWVYDATICPKPNRDKTTEGTYVSIFVRKEWKDKSNTRPENITVRLWKDNVEYDAQVLSEENGWEYTWGPLWNKNEDGGSVTWKITEDEVSGYTTEITNEGLNFLVTNTGKTNPPPKPPHNPGEKLPQTGLLWWPVPVLLCLGIVSLTVGLRRRRNGR